MKNNHTGSGVSRRSFVKATGTGVAVGTTGLAGCLGGDGGGGGDGAVILSADTLVKENEDAFVGALREAGLDEGVKVNVRAGDFETENRRSNYNSALESGRSEPDIFMMDSGWTIPFIVRDHLLNLSENLSQDVIDRIESEYFDMAVETAKDPQSGDLYGVPLWVGLPTMQYRKDLVEKAGYDPEGENWATEPISWQRFSEIAADVRDQAGVEYGFTTQAAAYEGLSCCTFNETMSSFGGAYFGGVDNLFGPVGERPITVNEQPVIDTVRMMQTFIHGDEADNPLEGYEQICPSAVVQWTEEDSRGPFTSGNAVFHRNWPYSIEINGSEDEGFGKDLGVMPLPYGVEEGEAKYEGTGGSRAALGGQTLTINPNSQRTEKALQVLEAVTAKNVALTIFKEIGSTPAVPSVFESEEARNIPVMGRYLDTLQFTGERAIPRPVTDIWPSQSQLIYQEVHDAYTLKKTPQEAMETLKSELKDSENR